MKRQGDADSLREALGRGRPSGGREPEKEGRPHFCGDIDMRIARDGTWHYQGSPIGRKRLVRLFSTVLTRDEAGHYWLVTPVEKARIRVDDAPFIAVEMTASGAGCEQVLTFRTNVGDVVRAGRERPIRMRRRPESREWAPYILVRDRLEALIARSVYYDLVELAIQREVDGSRRFGVWSEGVFFALTASGGLRSHAG